MIKYINSLDTGGQFERVKMSKGTMINEEIAVVLCFAICIAILVFAIMFKCTGGNNESITNNQTITEQR